MDIWIYVKLYIKQYIHLNMCIHIIRPLQRADLHTDKLIDASETNEGSNPKLCSRL